MAITNFKIIFSKRLAGLSLVVVEPSTEELLTCSTGFVSYSGKFFKPTKIYVSMSIDGKLFQSSNPTGPWEECLPIKAYKEKSKNERNN